ncbi:TPA: hypothetical protein TZ182_000415 [Streptococcus suis]|uniref:hypothetical protein n=1 Tax=Streptococcus ruminantium TaxID=1917441 RepID=UPI001F2FB0DB|nr:hypothetical protein [Streptococcus ruminantium]BDD37901.1 hypothetical protein GUT183_01390 [Streptococcus ruminantium]HEL1710017.1 hypothetical protein [Streptococcus suis]HEL2513717.1 hypothetical protein [Streptococcus suis]
MEEKTLPLRLPTRKNWYHEDIQRNLVGQISFLSHFLTQRFIELDDANTFPDANTLRLAEIHAKYCDLLIQSPNITAIVKELKCER